ncbi:protein kinase [Actinomadura sp. 1N219]|uniref:serine/threonine-protein kinase n=1 Tax=Actinomadura sp. 1N219 TaxID=3375152 RepID=UPI0037948D38
MRPLEPDDPRSVETEGRRYRVLARIGSGGMGVVYLGRSAAGRAVAIKMVHPEFAADDEFRDRFQREAAVARRVGGGFTAAVIDADPEAELPWLVTEYLPSVSVRDAVRSSGPLAADAVWELAAGIAEALVSIHEAGVVHRDLSPANVLLTADGPRVIDFGIARAIEAASVSRPGTRAGAAGFMSPEQAAGETIGASSDVFSLGSTLAFAATGREPFGDGVWHLKLRRVQSEAPRLDGRGDPGRRALIESGMRRDAERRPTTAELAERVAGRSTGEGERAASLPPSVIAEIARRRTAAENPPVPRPLLEPPAPAPALPGTMPPLPPGPPTDPGGTGRRGALLVGAAAAVALLVAIGIPAGLWTVMRDGGTSANAAPSSGTPTAASASAAASPSPTPTGTRGEITFNVEGSGTVSSLSYMVNEQTTKVEDVKLPWRKTVPMPLWPPRITWKLAYRAPSGGSSFTVEVDGNNVMGGQGSAGTNLGAEGVY